MGFGRAGHGGHAMTAPHGPGSSETTERLLEESRELLKDLTERLSSGEPNPIAAPADPA